MIAFPRQAQPSLSLCPSTTPLAHRTDGSRGDILCRQQLWMLLEQGASRSTLQLAVWMTPLEPAPLGLSSCFPTSRLEPWVPPRMLWQTCGAYRCRMMAIPEYRHQLGDVCAAGCGVFGPDMNMNDYAT